MRAGHPCRQGFGWRKRGRATLVSCKERKSRPLLPGYPEDLSMRIRGRASATGSMSQPGFADTGCRIWPYPPTASASGKALLPCLRELPPLLRQSLTIDNGSKMAGFRELERASDLLAYFCRPIHPGSAAPKGMAMPVATVFSKGHQFSQDHGGGAAERSRIAE